MGREGASVANETMFALGLPIARRCGAKLARRGRSTSEVGVPGAALIRPIAKPPKTSPRYPTEPA